MWNIDSKKNITLKMIFGVFSGVNGEQIKSTGIIYAMTGSGILSRKGNMVNVSILEARK
jgi:hypothetical protein